jgi:hypothetical protein
VTKSLVYSHTFHEVILVAVRRHQTPAKEAIGEGLLDLGVSVINSWWRVSRKPYTRQCVTKVLTTERVCRNWCVLAKLILSWFPATPVPQVWICSCNHTHLKIINITHATFLCFMKHFQMLSMPNIFIFNYRFCYVGTETAY